MTTIVSSALLFFVRCHVALPAHQVFMLFNFAMAAKSCIKVRKDLPLPSHEIRLPVTLWELTKLFILLGVGRQESSTTEGSAWEYTQGKKADRQLDGQANRQADGQINRPKWI